MFFIANFTHFTNISHSRFPNVFHLLRSDLDNISAEILFDLDGKFLKRGEAGWKIAFS